MDRCPSCNTPITTASERLERDSRNRFSGALVALFIVTVLSFFTDLTFWHVVAMWVGLTIIILIKNMIHGTVSTQ